MSTSKQARQTASLGNTMAKVMGQVGCITLILIGVAFGAGLLLDNLLNLERRIFTIVFLVGSVPVALYVITRVAMGTVAKAQDELSIIEAEDQSEL